MTAKSVILTSLTIVGTLSAADIKATESSTATQATDSVTTIDEIVVRGKKQGTLKLRGSVTNSDLITGAELRRAACCNLGESFTTNPSVDVSYNDAATGAKQIKLFGLNGTYVQMLTENIPNMRGAAAPYALGYLAGPWMQSIQVSKGASSVKNGYESLTGQINVEMLKPQTDPSLLLNIYADQEGKVELNATGNIHLSKRVSSALLLHGENSFSGHDANDDGFIDMPKVRQFAGMNRWRYSGDKYESQIGVKWLKERRQSGQHSMTSHSDGSELYKIDLNTDRVELFTKNAYIYDNTGANVALIVAGSIHDMDASYGHKIYNVVQQNLYASLMWERSWGSYHNLSTGLSYNYDRYNQLFRATHNTAEELQRAKEIESVAGGYAQYTFNYSDRLLLMAGLRYDHSSLWGNMFTPRLHAKWHITDALTIHTSAGRGYRTAHALADYSYLLASSREIVKNFSMMQEDAWNYGGGATLSVPLFGKEFSISAEYYYTDFNRQSVVDLDTDSHKAIINSVKGNSFSHTVQLEMTYTPLEEMTVTLAGRYNEVKELYGNTLLRKPLTPRWRGMLSVSYSPFMEIWQFDVTLAMNGGGRMPKSYLLNGAQAWASTFKAYAQLNAQVTRNFRHWSIYVGGDNITNYKQKTPIIDAANPWGNNFDATMVYAPLHGIVVYAGFRYKFTAY